MREGGALIEGFQTHALKNTPQCDVDRFTPQTFKFGHEICFGGDFQGCYDILKDLMISQLCFSLLTSHRGLTSRHTAKKKSTGETTNKQQKSM